MAVAWSPASHANEWKMWPNLESLTHREQTALGTYTNRTIAVGSVTACGKRRALTFRELAASAGVYTGANLVFLAPTAAFVATPKIGDILRDAASVDHTVLEIQAGKFGLTQRLVTIALSLVNGLRHAGTLLRPANTVDGAGKRISGLASVASDVPCRVQGITGTVQDDGFDGKAMKGKYTAYLGTRLIPKYGDVFATVVSSVQTRYTVVGWDSPDRLDQLMTLDLEDLTDQDNAV